MSARAKSTFEENCQKLRDLMARYEGGLRFHLAPPEVVQAVMDREKSPEFDKASIDDRINGCDYEDYISKYKTLLWYEEVHAMIEMREHDREDIRLTPYRIKMAGKPKCQLALNIPNLSKGSPSLVAGDVFVLDPCNIPEHEYYKVTSIDNRFGSSSQPTCVKIENTTTGAASKLPYPSEWSKQNGLSSLTTKLINRCKVILSPQVGDRLYIPNSKYFMGQVYKITSIKNDTATLGRPQFLSSTYPNQIDLHKFDVKYDVYPFSSGIPFVKCHDAMANAKPFLKEILCDPRAIIPSLEPLMNSTSNDTEILRDSLAKLNEHQQIAVLNILAGLCRPFPYIIFGPPGTGKTRTIIEAIVQIIGRDSSKWILVSANSNACADHLHEKLKQTGHIDPSVIERFVFEESSDKYKDGLKVHESRHQPSGRIIVSTNIFASRLDKIQFDYIFLDEAGHCHEPEALVPWNRLREGGCMILAGDPYQLGPVIQSQIAAKGGLGGSILDYFFALNHYKKTCGGYNNHFITKLNISYRCDPRILATSNKLSYDNEVICKGRAPQWLEKIFVDQPIITTNSTARADRPRWSTSWRNQGEVASLLRWLDFLFENGIKPSQIGIISFYALQRDDINQALRSKKRERKEKNHEDDGPFCHAATVDAFQGEERDIIIISTVRNSNHDGSTDGLQFLNDKRRFNVAVTRAKWLVIIIGQLELLRSSSHWSDYIGGALCIES